MMVMPMMMVDNTIEMRTAQMTTFIHTRLRIGEITLLYGS